MVLAYRALGLGDLLTALPALRALSDAWPEHHRVLATAGWLEPLARHAGVTDEVLHARPLETLPWRGPAPEIAVNLHGRGPESHRVVLATSPRRLVAFRHAAVAETRDAPEWRAEEHEVARWCRLLEESGVPADPGGLGLAAPDLAIPPGARGATLLHPGAASAARRWPRERWSEVAASLAGAGARVVITGTQAEAGLARAVAAGAGLDPGCVLAGRTGILELAALVGAAGCVVCGDTGVAHLATALGTASVVLFGPVAPELWGPPSDRPRHRALWAGESGDPHAIEVDAGLLEIGVGEVLAAVDEVARPPAAVGGGGG